MKKSLKILLKTRKFILKNRYVVNVEFFVHNLCKIDNLCLIYTKPYTMLKDGKVNYIYYVRDWGECQFCNQRSKTLCRQGVFGIFALNLR